MGPQRLNSSHMEGTLPCSTFYLQSSQGTRTQRLNSLLTSQAMEENRRGHSIHLWAPGSSQIHIQMSANECHSNEHHQNQVSGDKISQDSAKEPTQFDRGCTPKYTGDISPEPWTRRDLRHFEWDILNEKHSDPTGPQRMSWRVLGVATISLWGILLLVRGNLELVNCTHLTC